MIFGQRPVLQGAAATGSKVLANGVGALVALLVDMDEMPPVGMTDHRFGRYDLARQGVGHIDGTALRVGDAVPAVAEASNDEPFSHESPQAEIRRCRPRLRSVRG